jgi:ATP-binding cassette subfamily B protein
LSVGAWVGFNTLLLNVGYAISTLAAVIADLIPATTGLRRIEELLNEPVRVVESPHPVALPRLSRAVEFERVNFGYDGCNAPRILHDVNLRLPARQSVAFVGRSGSGKSTVLNLLMRFYDPDEGSVRIDGHELRQASEVSLRSQMAAVFQETFLFNTTLRENIRMGKVGATDQEVEAAAKAAEIHDLIVSLPQGYDTLAGERGGRLSGGQRQRIALARAIIRDPSILVLDEATSALDPETEVAINKTLKGLARSRTVLSVTHRLAPVADMDQIVVLDKGRVAEMGSHQELLKRQGIYFQLWNQQSGFTVSSDGRHAEVTPARLRAIPLFAGLDGATLSVVARQLIAEQYDADQIVFKEGAPGDKFYIIVRGKVSVTAAKGNNQVVQLDVWQDGDYVGEIALLEGVPRTATVRTLLPSLFLTLQREQFLKLLDEIPSMREAVEQSAQSRRLNLVLSGTGRCQDNMLTGN